MCSAAWLTAWLTATTESDCSIIAVSSQAARMFRAANRSTLRGPRRARRSGRDLMRAGACRRLLVVAAHGRTQLLAQLGFDGFEALHFALELDRALDHRFDATDIEARRRFRIALDLAAAGGARCGSGGRRFDRGTPARRLAVAAFGAQVLGEVIALERRLVSLVRASRNSRCSPAISRSVSAANDRTLSAFATSRSSCVIRVRAS